jgi:nitric oxide reductase subunit C
MAVSKKAIVFTSLLLCFMAYSFVVATSGIAPLHDVQMSSEAIDGKFLFQEYNCISCHQFYGLGGYMGPDLTNVISASGKGENYAAAFIRHGSSKMPDFKLSESQVNSLVEYLKFVDIETRYPITDFKINMDGTVVENGN